MNIFRRTILMACALGLVLGAGTAIAQTDKADGPILLTVTGSVSNTNRGGFDPETDKFFGYNEVEFSNAKEFDFSSLADLDMVKIKADFPKGRQVHDYEGPLLEDVLESAGATGDTVTIQALDGYAVEIPLKEIIDMGAVVALKRNGEMFGIGDFGPTQIVFPRAERSDLADMSDDNWVWSIFHINVK